MVAAWVERLRMDPEVCRKCLRGGGADDKTKKVSDFRRDVSLVWPRKKFHPHRLGVNDPSGVP